MRTFALALCALVALGCGSITPPHRTLPDRIQTVHLPMPRNDSFEYGFEEELARHLHAEFLADGRLQPMGRREADARLDTTVRRFNRRVVAFNDDDYPIVDEATITVALLLWEPGRERPTLVIDNLATSQFFLSDPRRSQFEAETEWHDDLLQRLAIDVVREVLTHREETEDEEFQRLLDEIERPADSEVDLDRDEDRMSPSIRSSLID